MQDELELEPDDLVSRERVLLEIEETLRVIGARKWSSIGSAMDYLGSAVRGLPSVTPRTVTADEVERVATEALKRIAREDVITTHGTMGNGTKYWHTKSGTGGVIAHATLAALGLRASEEG